MDWRSFEESVAQVLRAKGFVAEVTEPTSDGGIDIVAQREEPLLRGKYVVQCKNWTTPVGLSVVRDLYGTLTAERASKGILITTSSFTQGAIEFAKDKPLELIGGEQWKDLVKEVSPSKPSPAAEAEGPRMTEGVERLVGTFDELAKWARQKMRELDDLHEKEPIISADYVWRDFTSSEYRVEYEACARESIRSIWDTLTQVARCTKRLMKATSQWGLLKKGQTGDAQEELDHYVSRDKHLIDKSFAIYSNLRKVPPHPSLTDCHRDALEGTYYGLSALLSGFIRTPTKGYEGKTVYLEVEAPQDLHDYYVKRYHELTNAAWEALRSKRGQSWLTRILAGLLLRDGRSRTG